MGQVSDELSYKHFIFETRSDRVAPFNDSRSTFISRAETVDPTRVIARGLAPSSENVERGSCARQNTGGDHESEQV